MPTKEEIEKEAKNVWLKIRSSSSIDEKEFRQTGMKEGSADLVRLLTHVRMVDLLQYLQLLPDDANLMQNIDRLRNWCKLGCEGKNVIFEVDAAAAKAMSHAFDELAKDFQATEL